jgi:hypothetical protein
MRTKLVWAFFFIDIGDKDYLTGDGTVRLKFALKDQSPDFAATVAEL